MAVKTSATLKAENSTEITTAVAPESITPTILGDNLDDQIDSAFNKGDEDLDAQLIIPPAFSGQVTSPFTIRNLFQVLFNNLSIVMAGGTNSANQGRPGLFLAYIGTINPPYEAVTGGANTSQGPVIYANDFQDGGFDNGNNWSTYNYKVPAGGFNKKIRVSSLEIETVVVPTFADTTFNVQMLKNGSATGMPLATFTFGATAITAVGQMIYTPYFEMDFSSAPLVAGDTISIEIIRPSANLTSPLIGTFKITNGCISNTD